MRFGTTTAVLVLATGVIFGGAAAQVNPPGTKTTISANPWVQAELQPEHALLKGLVGHWTTTVHTYGGPFARVADTVGTADGKLLMGGLFVEVTQTETRMKQAFEAVMTYGFNEGLVKYTADSIDNAGTESVHFTGTYDAAKKQIVMNSHYTEGKLRRLAIRRTVTTFVDDKTWTYQEFVSRAVNAPEVPVVAITFKKG